MSDYTPAEEELALMRGTFPKPFAWLNGRIQELESENAKLREEIREHESDYHYFRKVAE